MADYTDSGAAIAGPYRYRLWRAWSTGARLMWIMLNPSTADAHVDDPTIRRCVGFARLWGFSGIEVVNLYALRSTDPKALLSHRTPIGPLNDMHIRDLAVVCCSRIAAWGAHPMAGASRVHQIVKLVGTLDCLGVTIGGAPRHPVRLPWTVERVAYYRPAAHSQP